MGFLRGLLSSREETPKVGAGHHREMLRCTLAEVDRIAYEGQIAERWDRAREALSGMSVGYMVGVAMSTLRLIAREADSKAQPEAWVDGVLMPLLLAFQIQRWSPDERAMLYYVPGGDGDEVRVNQRQDGQDVRAHAQPPELGRQHARPDEPADEDRREQGQGAQGGLAGAR